MIFASTSKFVLAVTAAALLSLSSLAYADGRPRAGHSFQRTTTVTGPQGRTATRDYSRTITENGFISSKSVTGPNGKTATKSRTVTRTRAP